MELHERQNKVGVIVQSGNGFDKELAMVLSTICVLSHKAGMTGVPCIQKWGVL